MKDDMKLEMQAGSNIQLDHIKEIMKENIPDLLAENQRLKAQLDREIHINRIMKRTLGVYATGKFDPHRFEEGDYAYATDVRSLDNGDLAKETLKQIEEME
jgi:hypothetical protein